MALDPQIPDYLTYEQLLPSQFAPPWLAGQYGTL